MSHDENSNEKPESSCGPGDSGHDAVIAEVLTLLDGESTPETRDRLRKHLEAYPGCLTHPGLKERINKLMDR